MPPPCPRHALLGAQMNDERSDLRLIPPRAGRAETDDISRSAQVLPVAFFCVIYVYYYSLSTPTQSQITRSKTDPV